MNLQGFVSANNRTLPPSFAMQNPPVSPAGSGTSGSALSVGKADSSPEGRALMPPTLGEVDCVARRRGFSFALLPPGGRLINTHLPSSADLSAMRVSANPKTLVCY